jgi:hypothetical protein
LISGYLRKVDENCTLLGYYIESSGNSLLKFQDEGIFKDLIGSIFKESREDDTGNFSRNVGEDLQLLAA